MLQWVLVLINNILTANFNPENPGLGRKNSRTFGIYKRARILGLMFCCLHVLAGVSECIQFM